MPRALQGSGNIVRQRRPARQRETEPVLGADVAQLVEQLTRNEQVVRSSRIVGSISRFSDRCAPDRDPATSTIPMVPLQTGLGRVRVRVMLRPVAPPGQVCQLRHHALVALDQLVLDGVVKGVVDSLFYVSAGLGGMLNEPTRRPRDPFLDGDDVAIAELLTDLREVEVDVVSRAEGEHGGVRAQLLGHADELDLPLEGMGDQLDELGDRELAIVPAVVDLSRRGLGLIDGE